MAVAEPPLLRQEGQGILGEYENLDTGIRWNVSVASLSKMVRQGIKAGEIDGGHAVRVAAAYHLPELIQHAKAIEVPDLRSDRNLDRLYDLFVPFSWRGEIYRLRIKGKATDQQGNKAHSMRVEDIVAEKVPLEGTDAPTTENQPANVAATNGEITLRQLFKGVNPYSGAASSIGDKKKVPLEGAGAPTTENQPANAPATNGEMTLRQLFKGVNPYSGATFSIGNKKQGERIDADLARLSQSPDAHRVMLEKARERFDAVMGETRTALGTGAPGVEGGSSTLSRERMIRALGDLDAVVSVLPAQARQRLPAKEPTADTSTEAMRDQFTNRAEAVKRELDLLAPVGSGTEAKPASLENPAKSPYRDEAGGLILGRPISVKKDPASAETEARFLKLANDPQTADRIYDSLPDSYGGKVINPDTAREILPEYRDREGRMENTIATGGVASAYAKDRFWRELTNPHGRKKLVLMAGGPGAGKSTFVDRALAHETDLVFDGTLRDTKWAQQSIDLALENGWDVSIQYVQRPMNDVFYGIVARSVNNGRWFPIRKLAQAHADAQKSVIRISEIYKGVNRVKFSYFAGPTDQIDAVKLSDIDHGGKWNYDETDAEQRGETLERKSIRDRSRQLEKGAFVGENQERLRSAIQERQIGERLLRYLARGDEGLLKLIGEVYGQK